MKLENVTKENLALVEKIKIMPNGKVEIFDTKNKDTRFVHQYSKDEQVLSISCEDNFVPESLWLYGVKKIMKLKYDEVFAHITPRGVVYLFKKDMQTH